MQQCSSLLSPLIEMDFLKRISTYYILFQLIISCNTKESTFTTGCTPPVSPLHGMYKIFRNIYVPTDIITFTCSSNTYLFGSESLRCDSNGQWNNSVPICATTSVRELTMKDKKLSNLTDGNYSTCTDFKEKPEFKFTYDGSSSDVILRIIHDHLDFKNPTYQQVYIKINEKDSKACKRIGTYERGINKFHEFKCTVSVGKSNTIYPYPSLRRICEMELFWKQNSSCPDLNIDLVKGSIRYENNLENKIVYGTVAIYSCKIGYQLSGESHRYCVEYGTWTGNGTTCIATGCGNYSSVENGQIIYTNKSNGGIARLQCNRSYKSKTSENVFSICQPNGTWTYIPFECKEIFCSELPETKEMKWTLEKIPARVGDKAIAFCYPNYALFNGPSVIECMQNGNWSKTNAICKAPISNTKIIIIAASIGASSSAFVFTVILCIIIFKKRMDKNKKPKDIISSYNSSKVNPMEGNEYFTIVYEDVPLDKVKKPTSPLPQLPTCETEFNYSEPIDQNKDSGKGNPYMYYTLPQDAFQIPNDSIRSQRKRRNSSADSTYWRDCDVFDDKSDVFKTARGSISKYSLPDLSMTKCLIDL